MGLFQFLKRSDRTAVGVRKSREGWFSKVLGLLDRGKVDEALWQELEELLVSADAGVASAAKLIERVRERARAENLATAEAIQAALRKEMLRLLRPNGAVAQGQWRLPDARPLVVLVVGVNGVGKTTSIAKLASYFREQGKQVVLAAADTFRAGAIEQLQVWGQRAGAEVIAHRAGADPGAVVHDALQATRSRDADVLIIDTAGRLHTKVNLMEELKKVRRVASKLDPSAPHATILVVDATTGQNALAQARTFKQAVDINGVFLAKLDGTAKGGIVLAISDELKLPILFIGTGERLDDLAPFDAEEFLEALFSREG